jgi:hypothetical protein
MRRAKMTSYNSASEWKPLASDTGRMTRAQLEAAAADPMNIFREKAEEEIRWRDRLGLRG